MTIEEKIAKAVKEFKTLTESDCAEIILASKTLTMEECFGYLLIDQSELSEAEIKFCDSLHRRGRAIGVKDASDKLFTHMATRNGGQSALEYLKQMSGDFSVEVTATKASGFQFNLTIPEPGAKAAAKVSTGK